MQVPLDLEPIAYKPSPPIIGGEQLAPVSPVGAPGAVSGSAPTASREEIAALELLLRSPESQAIVRDFGSASASASGVPGGNAVADSIIQRYGPDLAARLNQLHQAQNAVRQQYLDAMNAMRQARLPTQRTPEWYEAANGRSLPGWHFIENGVRFAGSPTDIPTGFRLGRFGDTGHWEFDPIDFTRHWAAGDSPAQRAFASLYGPDPLEFRYERRDSLSAGMNVRQHYYLGEQQLDISDVRNHGRGETFSEPWRHLRDPATGHEYIVTNTRPDSRLEPLGGAIDPARPPNLYHPEAVWFDPVHGWVTDPGNIKVKRDWFDRLVGFAATSFFAVVSGGVAGALTSSLIGQAAFTAAATGLMQQGTSGDGFSFRDVLRGAVGGALTAGLTQAAGLGGAASAAGAGERLMRITGQATIQGAIQDVLGGNFRDGFVQGLLSGAAGEVRARIDASIASRLNLSSSQRSMMHLLSRATGSALQALGNPNDPAAAFAQDFLGSVMSGLPMPQAQSRAPQAPSQDAAAQGPRQGANAQERPAAQAAQPQTKPAAQSVTVAAGDTLESLARQLYGSRWRAGLPVLMADNQITTNAWGSPLIRPGQSLQARPLDGLRASQIEQLSRLGGQVIGRNARGLNLREQIERIRAQAPAAPATPMRPSKPALPEWARPQDLAPTVENARRLGLPETTRPAANRSPSAERPQAPLPPVENLYAPAHGFYQERMRMATQGMMDPDASWMDRAVYAALGLGVTPLAMVEALGTEAYNSLNNASLAGQYWARGEMAANASDANVARLQAALHGAAAMNGLLGPAALTRPGIATNANPVSSITAADAGSVRHVNPTGSRQNCTNCAFVVDNQLATGNYASALPREKPLPFNELNEFFNTRMSYWTTREQIEQTLLRSGEGARGIVYGSDAYGINGHVWNAIVQNGRVHYIDGQTGFGGAANFEHFSRLRFGFTGKGK